MMYAFLYPLQQFAFVRYHRPDVRPVLAHPVQQARYFHVTRLAHAVVVHQLTYGREVDAEAGEQPQERGFHDR